MNQEPRVLSTIPLPFYKGDGIRVKVFILVPLVGLVFIKESLGGCNAS
jgi:hypothetical protein